MNILLLTMIDRSLLVMTGLLIGEKSNDLSSD